MISKKEIIGFSKIFDTENYEDYLSRINEIPKNLLIDVSTHLLSFYHADSFVSDHREFLTKWFCAENNELANEVNTKINEYIEEANKEIGIINARTSLTLFEKVLSSENNPPEISNENFEVLLFKIYLALNEKLNQNDDIVIDSIKEDVGYPRLICLAIANSLPTFDIANYDINSVFITQVIKTIYLLEFLESREDTKQLLTDFYNKFEVQDYKEFLGKLLPISFSVMPSKNTGKFDIVVNENDDFDVNVSFLDKLVINQIESEEEDVDYLNLRSNPLIKVSENIYRIIFPLFVLEKNFNGLYFLLKEINDGYEKKERINLRQLVTFDFSEKHMLYSLIERTYAKKYLKLSGEQMSTPGAPDYYIRNGNKIFIFESKDILINASIKESYDFEEYESALKDKLYFHVGKKKESAKAVKQLASFSKTILEGTFNEDSNYKPKSAKIYPIILLHNRQLDILGLNKLINIWFETELDSMNNEAVNIKNLRMPTIISIDTLILIHERLLKGEFKLENLLDEYQDYIDEERLKKKKFKNEEQLHAEIQDQLASFNMYIINKYGWKMPELFREKGISILTE
ncbi:MAG: hypothetical protein H6Q14_1782 [Bacteroidetes bacterium]|nr:hypothetical protein [Bacteroidota bacterium]